jgi:phenylacetate-CoA ligase
MNLYQDVFFRGLDALRGRRTIERLHFLRESQYWNADSRHDWQLKRLNELLDHARSSTPYYGRLLQDVRLPLSSLDDLSTLPVLTKRAIVDNYEGLQSRSVARERFVASRTGGSTGEPMRYFWDKRGMDWNRASVYRSAEWAGVALGERTIQMSGSHFDYSQSQKLQNQVVGLLQRYRDLPVGVLNDSIMEGYLSRIRSFRPTSIWGYASGVATMAEFVARAHPGMSLDFVKAVITSSETLRPQQRSLIDSVFGKGRVHDNYGSREMYIGAECRAHDGITSIPRCSSSRWPTTRCARVRRASAAGSC